MTNLFLNDKKALVLINLMDGPTYVRHVADKSDTMYSHALQTLRLLENKKYVESRKQGRIRIYQLTEKGQKTAALIKELWECTQE